jgi:formamidopyrimidine-DNA glycosylase
MPELPDVEKFKRYLDATSLHAEIVAVHTDGSERVFEVDPGRLEEAVVGRELESTVRHGKYLLAEVTGAGWLALHFGMTGFLKYFKDMEKDPDHDRLRLDFSDGYHLAYDSQRKLGEVDLVEDPEALVESRELGPDALDPDLNLTELASAMAGRRATVKSVLMDQSFVAGVGNIYADEILFQSRVHPGVRASEIEEERLVRILGKMGEVLRAAIDANAELDRLPEGYLLPHREQGASCPGCGGEVEKIAISGRPTYVCPRCQQ